MQLADPQQRSAAYLILRDLYNGEVIHWPIPDDHPLQHLFAALEAQRLIARWDRMWPLRDRYRLTEAGIAAIEAAYRPAGAEDLFEELRNLLLPPPQRRAYLEERGLDPTLWPVLHDPSIGWDTYRVDGGRWLDYLWEDRQPARRAGHAGGGRWPVDRPPEEPLHARDPRDRDPVFPVPYVVDLDAEAGRDPGGSLLDAPDRDVS